MWGRLGPHVVLSIPVGGRTYGCHQGDVCLSLCESTGQRGRQ